MSCPSCASGHLSQFSGELMLHLIGFKNVNNPGVLLFPEILVCVNCGHARFNVPATELALLTVSPRVEQPIAREPVV